MKYFLGTTFYSALIFKKAPGTMSSIAVALVLFAISPIPFWFHLLSIAVLLVMHFYSFPFFEKKFENDDPSIYTIDEALAVTSLLLYSQHYAYVAGSLIVFRFFDILKPLGISRLEKMASLPSWFRNLADDMLAALYTFIILLLASYVI